MSSFINSHRFSLPSGNWLVNVSLYPHFTPVLKGSVAWCWSANAGFYSINTLTGAILTAASTVPQNFGSSAAVVVTAFDVADDGSKYVAGYLNVGPNTRSEPIVIKYNPDGTIAWDRHYSLTAGYNRFTSCNLVSNDTELWAIGYSTGTAYEGYRIAKLAVSDGALSSYGVYVTAAPSYVSMAKGVDEYGWDALFFCSTQTSNHQTDFFRIDPRNSGNPLFLGIRFPEVMPANGIPAVSAHNPNAGGTQATPCVSVARYENTTIYVNRLRQNGVSEWDATITVSVLAPIEGVKVLDTLDGVYVVAELPSDLLLLISLNKVDGTKRYEKTLRRSAPNTGGVDSATINKLGDGRLLITVRVKSSLYCGMMTVSDSPEYEFSGVPFATGVGAWELKNSTLATFSSVITNTTQLSRVFPPLTPTEAGDAANSTAGTAITTLNGPHQLP